MVNDPAAAVDASQRYSIRFISADTDTPMGNSNKWLENVKVNVPTGTVNSYSFSIMDSEGTAELEMKGGEIVNLTFQVLTDFDKDADGNDVPNSVVTVNGWKAEWDGDRSHFGIFQGDTTKRTATYVAKHVVLNDNVGQRYHCYERYVASTTGGYLYDVTNDMYVPVPDDYTGTGP